MDRRLSARGRVIMVASDVRPKRASQAMFDRDFPGGGRWSSAGPRAGVCRRCGLIMSDAEPAHRWGQFWHLAEPHQTRALRCRNNGTKLDMTSPEVVPFMKKSRRRFLKRNRIKA